MDTLKLKEKFEAIGARLRVRSAEEIRRWNRPRDYAIDVAITRQGETFELIMAHEKIDARVLDLDRAGRHLLLVVDSSPGERRKFLCGHDERHWFVAGVPLAAAAVEQAKELLKPAAVVRAQESRHLKARDRHRRRNAAFVRQGEWFFVPVPDLRVDPGLILRREPIRRGLGKPHVVELLYRQGGVSVRVCRAYPNGLTHAEYAALIRREPEKAALPWTNMVREPTAYAKGRVRHSDHATIVLPCWHRIFVNGEVRTENVAFLD